MKKVFIAGMIAVTLFSCSQPQKQQTQTAAPVDTAAAAAAAKTTEMKMLYEKNLGTLKQFITAFENKDAAARASLIADNVVWHSPAYGDMDSSGTHWKQMTQMFWDNFDSLKLKNAVFLPGVDQKTQMLDGSVRYYGEWSGIYKKNKKKADWQFYGTYDFDKDGKVVNASQYYDVGGLKNAVGMK